MMYRNDFERQETEPQTRQWSDNEVPVIRDYCSLGGPPLDMSIILEYLNAP